MVSLSTGLPHSLWHCSLHVTANNEVWLVLFAGIGIGTADFVLPHSSRGFGRIMRGLSRVSRITLQISHVGFCLWFSVS
jgi:hypothetical protein